MLENRIRRAGGAFVHSTRELSASAYGFPVELQPSRAPCSTHDRLSHTDGAPALGRRGCASSYDMAGISGAIRGRSAASIRCGRAPCAPVPAPTRELERGRNPLPLAEAGVGTAWSQLCDGHHWSSASRRRLRRREGRRGDDRAGEAGLREGEGEGSRDEPRAMPRRDQGRLGGRRGARPSAGGRRPAGKPVCGLPRGGRRPLRRARPRGNVIRSG